MALTGLMIVARSLARPGGLGIVTGVAIFRSLVQAQRLAGGCHPGSRPSTGCAS
ncbi:hypothetical protein AOX55_00003089 [Sinorhizobium fredii CCBAU 25509]|nr:hypothetical protein AOX55_00003089 [Sinorhizobium fredii CCBAU 25509]